ncbi:MAG: sulfide-dependent adenosine diphosphate thiazole synthase [Candidatus Thermoplasmatota archaeon]|nr:sulfide-dependent adenosine diphosphate thiazole synthase [Candidatus Thermoplasmatota archaeon]
MIDDARVTESIVNRFFEEFSDHTRIDVAIAGAGPAGLVAGRYLAEKGYQVAIFERKLSPGGGMWGGGMGYPVVVLQESSVEELEKVGVKTREEGDGYYTADSVSSVANLLSSAIDAGCRVFNMITVEDVLYEEGSVKGFVINSSPIETAGLHVDPITIRAEATIDATGHDAEVCNVVEEKAGELETEEGTVMGEKSMWAEVGEKTVVENTQEVFPGLWVTGMCANAVMGAPRMGPIFGGMLLSGKKVAELIDGEI